MRGAFRSALAVAGAASLAAVIGSTVASGRAQPYKPPGSSTPKGAGKPAAPASASLAKPLRPKLMQHYATRSQALLKTPVSGLFPGGISTAPNITNPAIGNPTAIQRGMKYFSAFNCVGCHAANAGGGIGPALSTGFFKFGGSPANIYLTIEQGRADGMPAWGSMLPSGVIWDLVAYILQISKAPHTEWGTTISPSSPSIQQVPAEFKKTDEPWSYTQPFTKGQKPAGPAPGQ